jgi:hypothetical protein
MCRTCQTRVVPCLPISTVSIGMERAGTLLVLTLGGAGCGWVADYGESYVENFGRLGNQLSEEM